MLELVELSEEGSGTFVRATLSLRNYTQPPITLSLDYTRLSTGRNDWGASSDQQ
eukprot:COSAG03_NODE_659_length_6400_cov_27.197746_5_plen_54_part_00